MAQAEQTEARGQIRMGWLGGVLGGDRDGRKHSGGEGPSRQIDNPRGAATARDVLRAGGRVALWAVLALVMVRGVADILAEDPVLRATETARAKRAFPGPEAEAFAVSFARAYLTWAPGHDQEHRRAVSVFLASGLRDRAAALLPSRGAGQRVAQATVAREQELGGGRALVTVACSFDGDATRYLTVPVAADRGGGLVVFDLPSLDASPRHGDVPAAELRPLLGTQAAAMTDVVRRFLGAYLAGRAGTDVSYLLAPGVSVAPMAPGLEVVSVDRVDQTQASARAGIPVVAWVRVRDRASGATYPLSYRLRLTHRDRWYVAGIGGAA